MTSSNDNSPGRNLGFIIALTLIALIGEVVWVHYDSPQVQETPAPGVPQADGSKILPRAPDAKAKPAHQVPKGAKVERIEQVTVQPDQPGPVHVDLSIVRLQDQSRRVIASSPDGEVIAGVDIPVEPINSVAARNWSAGLSFDPLHQTPGAWVERDIGFVRLGLDFNQTRIQMGGPTGYETRLRVGVSW